MRIDEHGTVCTSGDEMEEFMEWANEQPDFGEMTFKEAVKRYISYQSEEEKTVVNLRFCFWISPEAEMAHDEDGNPAECYSQIKLGGCKNPPDDMRAEHKRLAVSLAKQLRIDPEWVIPITEEEYDHENGEETES
ncbi:hypothetical protein M5X00_29890 [Paenibacillus alvei]|uniref:hypothetical protein n=1 Tax=Paenibacillus alvei TaxID=44250 RepID=UPI0002882211|nr:hypothetical protein [Paenibacillus alvei]EJW14434.1 hypothetical protein PAV_13c00530 [Paenibacillus alvei DSM 29]MCY9545185.1 hypothetical protein [Paenibacillus alvei]MCY9708194.1 hypothetical protein [Paenibacillus alvei]MCY9737902.1 hypothetical protein [Paenibacillus alvei]MCY9758434.1 hypothetical protein [Paenibacillus alvei]